MAFIKEREAGCTRDIDEEDETRTQLKLCRGKVFEAAEEVDKSHLAMSTLKRTLDMTAPITNDFMQILDTSEEVAIGDFVSN